MTDRQFNNFSDFLSWETSTRDCIDLKKIYVDMAGGDLVAGVLLSQIVFWHLPSPSTNKTKLRVKKRGHLWIAKARTDWYEECRVGPRQFDRASKVLIDLGIIEKKTFKFAGTPTSHVRILAEPFLTALEEQQRVATLNAIEAEDDYVAYEKAIDRMAEDAGSPTLFELAPVCASDYLSVRDHEGVRSTSPNGEDLLQREKTLTLLPSKTQEEERSNPVEKKESATCAVCRARPPVKAAVDKHGRCATCLFVDGWEHFVRDRTPAYSMDNGSRDYVGIDNIGKIQTRMVQRLKDPAFKAGWIFALERAGRMEYLRGNSWFNPEYFLRNTENWKKIVSGTFDSFEEQKHQVSYAMLTKWLRRKEAGLRE